MKIKKRNASTPGVKPSGGVKRKIPYLFMLNADEWEYLNRAARGVDLKISPFLRSKLFTNRWPDRLLELRKKQGANVK